MALSAGPRKFVLTAHVLTSVGWIGAVAGFLALAVTGLSSSDDSTVRGAYVSMDVMAVAVIAPLALMSLATGFVQSLGTVWGLFRHYWVLIKFVITVIAVVVLLSELSPISALAERASASVLTGEDRREERTSLIVHSGGGLVLLLAPMVLSIYKPRGLTRYGRRKAAARS